MLFLTKVCGRKAKACQAVVIDGQLPTVAKARPCTLAAPKCPLAWARQAWTVIHSGAIWEPPGAYPGWVRDPPGLSGRLFPTSALLIKLPVIPEAFLICPVNAGKAKLVPM